MQINNRATYTAFNRTILKLKRIGICTALVGLAAFNRTILELKLFNEIAIADTRIGF